MTLRLAHRFAFCLLLATPLTALALDGDDLLEPEKAFLLQTQVRDAQTVEARFKIAKGYYLYRNKLKFEAVETGVLVKDVALPSGIRKHDEFFGDVETYRDSVKAVITLARNEARAQDVRLRITSQGCADVGVCYPPQTQTVTLKLPTQKAAAAAPAPKAATGGLGDLAKLISPTPDGEFLHPDEAFKPSVASPDAASLVVRLQIAPGYYLYRDKTSVKVGGAVVGAFELPRGKVKVDQFIGKTEVYHDALEVTVPVSGARAGAALEVELGYQGCAEKGICYPPTTKTLNVVLGSGGTVVPELPASERPAAAQNGVTPVQFWLAVLAAFGTGLLLSFTPCVLPMIPILSSVIVGSSDRNITKLEGGMLSGAYVLGTAVTYTAAGVLAGATGEQMQAYFQNIWAIGTLSLIFVGLALAMFGFYELQMPSFLQSMLHQHSHDLHSRTKHIKGGALFGVFVMGLLAALIIGACVSPLLISALSIAVTYKDPILGGAIMFAMALGMGMILMAVGVGAGAVLPKAGPWMNTIKHVFGVLLLAVAIYILNAVPQVPVLLLWSALLITTGVYMGATQSLPKGADGWDYLWKGLGTFLLAWGAAAMLGGFYGERDVFAPLPRTGAAATTVGATAPAAETHFERVRDRKALDAAFAAARAAGKPVLFDFYATWCTDCVRMEKSTFRDARVAQALAGFALIQADVTDNNDEARAIKERYGIYGPPAMLFFGHDGAEKRDLRFYGYRDAEAFLRILERAGK